MGLRIADLEFSYNELILKACKDSQVNAEIWSGMEKLVNI